MASIFQGSGDHRRWAHRPGSFLRWPFSVAPCLSSKLQSLFSAPSTSHTKNLLPVFILPSLPSPYAKVIRLGPPPLSSVSPPHVSRGCPSRCISLLGCSTASYVVSLHLTLLPPHTLHLYNPQILSSLLFSLWNGMCTPQGVVSWSTEILQKDTC